IQNRRARELEKNFSNKHVVFVDDRTILPKPTRKLVLPTNKKDQGVVLYDSYIYFRIFYNAILKYHVFPTKIVGKWIRVRLDGLQLIKIHLDKNQQTTIEHKVDIFASVYKLTDRKVIFEFPELYL
uniref:40S ribosomal protein S7 n=1 Tax=Diabrotica virgifera virgifera TaxID=50390 RepID=A0A6P7HGN8_DIAVI